MNFGTNIFEEEWDLLIVLDACRVDAIQTLVDEYDILSNIQKYKSVGSATLEWSAKTFIKEYSEEIAKTALVSGNGTVSLALEEDPQYWAGVSERESWLDSIATWNTVESDDFFLHDKVWDYGYRDPFTGTLLPECVTDRTISVARNHDPSRIIAHYLPPHAPYRSEALRANRELAQHEREPWQSLRSGTPTEDVWKSYLNEIRWGLEHVSVLLQNVNAEKVVITADHGEMFGEYGIYSHPAGVPMWQLRNVPWVETTATDEGTYTPSMEVKTGPSMDVQNRLKRLGYM